MGRACAGIAAAAAAGPAAARVTASAARAAAAAAARLMRLGEAATAERSDRIDWDSKSRAAADGFGGDRGAVLPTTAALSLTSKRRKMNKRKENEQKTGK